MLLTQAHYISLLTDEKGDIVWIRRPKEALLHDDAVNFLFKKNIREFYAVDLGQAFSAMPMKSLDELKAHFGTRDPNLSGTPQSLMTEFSSRNAFERKFYDFNLITRLPMSHLRMLRILPGYYLGIIFFNTVLKYCSQWNEDMSVVADEENRLVGYNEAFRDRLGRETPGLGTPLDKVLSIDFMTRLRDPVKGLSGGETVFRYPGGELETSDPALVRETGSGLAVSTLGKDDPLFLRLPAETDFRANDYRLQLLCEKTEGEPLLCILNSGPLERSVFPDEFGLLFGPRRTAARAPEGPAAACSFILKKQGAVVSLFHNVRVAPLAPDNGFLYTITKTGGRFLFAVNGKTLGAYSPAALPDGPGCRGVTVGLRPGTSCLVRKIVLSSFPLSGENALPEEFLAFFRGRPDESLRVHSYYFSSVEQKSRYLNYMRLEDLNARQKIGLLVEKTREQEKEIRKLRQRIAVPELTGTSEAADRMRRTLSIIAGSAVPVLITGETGSGKSYLAEIIHQAGPRSQGPFVKVDCAVLPATLVESELFGFEKGAFTGADSAYRGKFEQANGGTLFLDEVSNIALPVQMKLLTVLQDLKITRIGGTRAVPLDIRVISATNRDLKTLVSKGLFREDLYYRLNVLYLDLPPLRERPADIPELCEEFLSRELSRHGTNVRAVSPAVYPKLMEHGWPGNIRELQNVLLKAILLCDGPVLEPRHLELPSAAPAGAAAKAAEGGKRRSRRIPVERIREEIQKCGGNVSWAAENLKISRFTIYNKLGKMGLRPGAIRT